MTGSDHPRAMTPRKVTKYSYIKVNDPNSLGSRSQTTPDAVDDDCGPVPPLPALPFQGEGAGQTWTSLALFEPSERSLLVKATRPMASSGHRSGGIGCPGRLGRAANPTSFLDRRIEPSTRLGPRTPLLLAHSLVSLEEKARWGRPGRLPAQPSRH